MLYLLNSFCPLAVITFSDDNDNLPDSSGEYTGASLTKSDMPKDFTICSAYMVKAWTTDWTSVDLFRINREDGYQWAKVQMSATDTNTEFVVYLGLVSFVAHRAQILLPLYWTRACLSLDTVTGNIRLVVNGKWGFKYQRNFYFETHMCFIDLALWARPVIESQCLS